MKKNQQATADEIFATYLPASFVITGKIEWPDLIFHHAVIETVTAATAPA
ncbi:hypothetical protein [Acinetobacter indicus]|nr:hypothetical protein [Acinetobacter indicus]